MLAFRSLLLRGEHFGFDAWSASEYDWEYGSQLLVSLEWVHAVVPTPFVVKVRKISEETTTPEEPKFTSQEV